MIYFVASRLLRTREQSISFSGHYLFLDVLWLDLSCLIFFSHGWNPRSQTTVFLILYTLVICVTDFQFRIIPNLLTYIYIIIGLTLTLVIDHLSFVDALAGGAVGLGFFWMIAAIASKTFGREAMGGGDIKLAAMLGIFVGWQGTLLVLFFGSISALLYAVCLRLRHGAWRIREIPFGPFLAGAGVVVFAFGEQLVKSYLRLLL